MFEQSVIAPDKNRKPWTFAVSIMVEVAAVILLLLIPLIYTERLGLGFIQGLRISPPASKPIGDPVQRQATTKRSARVYRHSLIPTRIVPLQVLLSTPSDPLPQIDDCANCVANAIPAVFGLGERLGTEFPPPPPKREPKPVETRKPEPTPQPEAPVRVSSSVQEAKILRRIIPTYPPLARQARVQGTVKLQGMIGKDGTIQELVVLSGHPLLVNAAVSAVKQWLYRPTYLNGKPVEVSAPIDVNFILSN